MNKSQKNDNYFVFSAKKQIFLANDKQMFAFLEHLCYDIENSCRVTRFYLKTLFSYNRPKHPF